MRKNKQQSARIILVSLFLYVTLGWTSIVIASTSVCPDFDLDGDCIVNLDDFALFASQWLAQRLDCNLGYEDCDDFYYNGCETHIYSAPNNCGGCGVECNVANASSECVNGNCAIGECLDKYVDCDGITENGCEFYLGDYDNPQNDCTTALTISPEICGDEGQDTSTLQGKGTKWCKVKVVECSDWDNDLNVAITLSSPEGANYDMVALEGSCLSNPDPATGDPDDCADDNWSDTWGSDDDKWIYILVYHVSGSSCENWALTAWGNSHCQ